MLDMKTPVIELSGITKIFAGTVANDRIDLRVDPGSVHALLGENGAGKSTLMKILYGMYQPDEGAISVKGRPAAIRSPLDAAGLGIGMIHQHFTLVPVHSVIENVILGLPYRVPEATKKLGALMEQFGLEVNPHAITGDLPVGLQQRVEILKALYRGGNVLIMDEPTAVLTPGEVERLFIFIREFRGAGNSVIFISHKMGEVLEIADQITVLRGGRVAGALPRPEATETSLVRMMVGHAVAPLPVEKPPGDRTVLRVENLSVRNAKGLYALEDCSFAIRSSEIFAVAGVSGNGQEELADVLAGLREAESGKIVLGDEDITNRGAGFCIEAGVGYIPEDRHKVGLVLDMSVEENFVLKSSGSAPFCRRGIFSGLGGLGRLDRRRVRETAEEDIRDYAIKTPSARTPVRALSGGNQQKIVVARETRIGTKFLIAFQPTRGLDIGAAHHVHSVLLRCRREGKGILLISTELSEVLELADRIGVVYRGRLKKIFGRAEADIQKIGLLMAGGEAS